METKHRVLLVFAVFAFVAVHSPLRAGVASLKPDEVTRLRTLLGADAAAAQQFVPVRAIADAALGERPDPVEQVISEGRLVTDPRKVRTIAALRDMPKIEALGRAWAATGNRLYADKAREFILAWAKVNKPDGNPINETKFEPLITAYDLLRDTFPANDRALADGWLRKKAETLMQNKSGNTGNWFCHKLMITGLAGLTLGDETLTNWALEGFRRHIGANFKADGSSDDFHKRDALHYHLYAVEPLLSLAIAGERHGESLFDYRAPNGASLHAAVDFVIPFAEGGKTHTEFARSKVAFDQTRAMNGETEYQPRPWEPKASIDMFSAAAWFRPEYGALAAKIAGEPSAKFPNWRMVMNAVSSPRSVPVSK